VDITNSERTSAGAHDDALLAAGTELGAHAPLMHKTPEQSADELQSVF